MTDTVSPQTREALDQGHKQGSYENVADVDTYFAVKSSFVKANQMAQDSTPAGSFPYGEAMKELDTRLRAIIGPVSIGGKTPTISLDALESEGNMGGEQLDGLLFGNSTADTMILVSTPELVEGWLRSRGDSTSDMVTGLSRPDPLTWAFPNDAHVEIFADVKKNAALPEDVIIALLIARAQDSGTPAPRELVLGLQRGKRIYLMLTRTAVRMPTLADCPQPYLEDGAALRRCYAERLATLPELQTIVTQIGQLAALIPRN